jgi:hypothetical protein
VYTVISISFLLLRLLLSQSAVRNTHHSSSDNGSVETSTTPPPFLGTTQPWFPAKETYASLVSKQTRLTHKNQPNVDIDRIDIDVHALD